MGSADDFFRAMGIPRYDDDAAAVEASPPVEARSPVDDLESLWSEVEALQRQFARSQDPSARHTGQDSSAMVRVTTDGDGRAAEVALEPSWREAVGSASLGAAVLAAFGDAQLRRLAAWSTATAGSEQPSDTGPAPWRMEAAAGAPADSADARRSVLHLLSLLEGVEGELDGLDRRLNERVAQQVVGRSPSHQVVIRMGGGGQPTDVEVRRQFIDRSDDRRIVRELQAAFDDAYERTDSLGLGNTLGAGALGELHALGSDPVALLRQLGLGLR